MRRVLLLGYFGAGNFGDDALLADWLIRNGEWLRNQGLKADILCGQADPLGGFIESPALREIVGRLVPKRTAITMPTRDYRAVIAPGGSLLQDASSLRSLLFYLWVIRRFALSGVPVFLLHQGIGPLQSQIAKRLTPAVLRLVRLLSLRDQSSYEWAMHQGGLRKHPHVYLSCDPILGATFSPYPDCPGLASLPAEYLLAMPRPTGDLPYPGDRTEEPAALAQCLAYAAKRTGLPVVLLPLHHGQDDAFCQAVAEAGGPQMSVLALAPKEAHRASAIWQAIGGARLVISHRLHGLVSAASRDLPAMGVAYDPKVSAFCDGMGYPWCYPATVHEVQTLEKLDSLWEGREALQQDVQARRLQSLKSLAFVEEQLRELW